MNTHIFFVGPEVYYAFLRSGGLYRVTASEDMPPFYRGEFVNLEIPGGAVGCFTIEHVFTTVGTAEVVLDLVVGQEIPKGVSDGAYQQMYNENVFLRQEINSLAARSAELIRMSRDMMEKANSALKITAHG